MYAASQAAAGITGCVIGVQRAVDHQPVGSIIYLSGVATWPSQPQAVAEGTVSIRMSD